MHDDTPKPQVFEFVLGDTEAILAGTLTLMTAMAQGCCPAHRQAIRDKVIANLRELEVHRDVSPQFRAAASHLKQHWLAIGASPSAPRLYAWHRQPAAVQ